MSRMDQVNDLIRDEVSKILTEVIGKDFLATVLRAQVSKDLKNGVVWISILSEEPEKDFSNLLRKSSEIQRFLGERISLKRTPRLEFQLDKSTEYASNIQKLLDKIKEDEKK